MNLDTMYQKGDTALTKHNAVVMPDNPFGNCPMNATNTASGGYVASDMYTKCIPVVDDNLEAVFGNHLIQFRNLFTNSIDTTGSATNARWFDCKSFLLSEIEVYGSIAFSSSGYDVGTGNRQFAAFRLNPRLINYVKSSWWLRSIQDSTYFCRIYSGGSSNRGTASSLNGVRPAFLIG